VFAAKLIGNDPSQLVGIELENFCDEPQHENVFAFVLGGAAESFDGQTGDRDADVNVPFVVQVRLDVVGIVKQDAALAEKADVVLITVLIERDQKIGVVAG